MRNPGGTVLEHRTKQRFPLRLAVQLKGTQGKLEATTKDLSAAGIFIEATPTLRVGAKVGFRLVLPAKLLGTPQSVTVECQAHVVRVQRPSRKKAGGRMGVACVIDSYTFERKN